MHRDSAGFDDVVALDIDEKRGDLWVATAEATEGKSALHRLQLVSARPLMTYRTSPSIGSTRLVDLTVQASGDVIALDSSGNRLLALARGGSDMTVAMSLKFSNAKSVAARGDGLLYVAHDAGIARVDLRSGTIAELAAPTGFDLRRFDVIRVHRNALIGRQTTPAGTRQLVRLNLNAAGLAVRDGTVIDPQVPETKGQLSLSITGDELYYLTTVPDEDCSSRPRRAAQRWRSSSSFGASRCAELSGDRTSLFLCGRPLPRIAGAKRFHTVELTQPRRRSRHKG